MPEAQVSRRAISELISSATAYWFAALAIAWVMGNVSVALAIGVVVLAAIVYPSYRNTKIDEWRADRAWDAHRQVYEAMLNDNKELFSELLSQLESIDAKRNTLKKPFKGLLFLAAEAGATEYVEALVDAGSDINQKDTFRGFVTPLHLAAAGGHSETVSSLISRGANIDATNQHGWTALHYACRHEDVVNLLASAGADVNGIDGMGWTPLFHASVRYGGCPEVVRLLLAHGADANVRTNSGETTLESIRSDKPRHQNKDIIALLESQGGVA